MIGETSMRRIPGRGSSHGTTPDSGSGAHPLTRRRLALAGAAASLAVARPATAASRTIYFMRGKGASSLLPETDYQAMLRNLFKADKVVFDLDGGRAQFLSQFFAADIAYLSLHASETKLKVGNGDVVEAADLQRAYQQAGKGPTLTIVAGCNTTKDSPLLVNIPESIGIGAGKRAYIGFHTPVVGFYADRFFRFFFPHWVNPAPGGSYRTLVEAGTAAHDFIDARVKAAAGSADRTVKPGVLGAAQPQDKLAHGSYDVLGNRGLRISDI